MVIPDENFDFTYTPGIPVFATGTAVLFCIMCLQDPENDHPNQASLIVGGATICLDHFRKVSNDEESNMVTHARTELELLGEDEETIAWYLSVIEAFSDFGHSGFSAAATIPVLTKLLQLENLTPITDNPDEWFYHAADEYGVSEEMWQNRRNSALFSDDGGKTYWSVAEGAHDGHREPKHTSEPYGG